MKIIGIIIGILVIILIILGLTSGTEEDADNGAAAEGQGTVYFSITDDAADIESINEVEVTIERIEVFSQAQGWSTVSSDTRSYRLLELNARGKVELYSSSSVAAGTYERMRVVLGETVVDHESEGQVEAVVPTSEMAIEATVVVEEGNESHVTLDFIADESLHTSAGGEFVFAPVVEVESRSNADVEVRQGNEVNISGGAVDANVTVGVDLNGETRAGFKLDTSAGLEVESAGVGGVRFMLGGEAFPREENPDGNDNADEEASGEVDTSTEGSVEAGEGETSAETDTEADVNVNI